MITVRLSPSKGTITGRDNISIDPNRRIFTVTDKDVVEHQTFAINQEDLKQGDIITKAIHPNPYSMNSNTALFLEPIALLPKLPTNLYNFSYVY